MFTAKQAKRHPGLRGDEGEEHQPPQGMVAGSSGSRCAVRRRFVGFHEGRMVTAAGEWNKTE